ncbi:branched-chain amino acid ABC transporter permease [Conexibacter woesei]|uniref:branched-chain amino acid ABC transporter permease n=1 Tax=Conexibacter woesei TaxID=191495 RepID=UPI00040385DD|nr:branched-chain amino acid ABC transporter permease [Conexibacter woesei]
MLQVSTTIAGLIGGGAFALLGLCTMMTYRFVSVVNFTQAAIGALGAFCMVLLHEKGLPLIPAVLVGLVVGALAHGVIGLMMVAWFSEGSEEIKAAVTVTLFTALLGLGGLLFGAAHPHNFPDPFDQPAFTIADVTVVWTVVVICGLAVVFTIVPVLVLKRTHAGLLLRALSSRPGTAQLVGVAAPRLAMAVWLLTGAATALAIMAIAPSYQNDFSSLSLLITWAFAAALIGGFQSFWGTLFGGLGLGALQGLLSSLQSLNVYRGVVPLVVIVLVLLWHQRHDRWGAVA